MATAAPDHDQPLDLKEQIVRIDKMIADTQKAQIETQKIAQDKKLAIWQICATLIGAAAAFFAAGAAVVKVFG